MYANISNFNPDDFPGEVNELPSCTVPDQALSLEEILTKYASGGAMYGNPNLVYGSDLEFDYPVDPRTMDLADLDALRREVQEHIDMLRSQQTEVPPVVAAPADPKPDSETSKS